MVVRARALMRIIHTVMLLAVAAMSMAAQESQAADSSARPPSRIALTFTAGFTAPKSKDPITQFWKGGPNFGVNLLVPASGAFSVGIGADVSMLWFRLSSFAEAYPSVPVQRKDLAWFNLFLLSRYFFMVAGPVQPYAELAIGASRLSGAEYKAVVDSVRVTYYEIPARTRLALTFTGGLKIPVSRSFSFLAEAGFRYVHNDESLGIAFLLVGGVRIIL